MKKYDLKILFPLILISSLGLITLLSTQLGDNLFSLNNIFIKQFIFVILGFVVFFLTTKFDIVLFKYNKIVFGLYFLTLILLVITLIFGQEINGAKRWINIIGIQLQPSELAKITVIITTAYIFTLKDRFNQWLLLIISFILTLPILLLVYLEPHGSMTLIIMLLWFISAFISLNNPQRNILLLIIGGLNFIGLFFFTAFNNSAYLFLTLVGILGTVFVYFSKLNIRYSVVLVTLITLLIGGAGSFVFNTILDDYQRQRIVAFQDPAANSLASAFNVEQSKIAIGSGGLFGKGFANGSQTRLKILPFHQTDFIFATYAEEFGFVGSILLITLYLIILISIIIFIVKNYNYTFENTIILGLTIKFFIEIFINLGTNLGIIPATGIPLPLMSAGGSITILTFFSLGLIQCIISSVNQREQFKLSN